MGRRASKAGEQCRLASLRSRHTGCQAKISSLFGWGTSYDGDSLGLWVCRTNLRPRSEPHGGDSAFFDRGASSLWLRGASESAGLSPRRNTRSPKEAPFERGLLIVWVFLDLGWSVCSLTRRRA